MKSIKIIILSLCVLSLNIQAQDYALGLKYIQNEQFKKAFPIVLKEAENDNRAAQYRLAQMYENGQGVKKNYQEAMLWYKEAANKYSYTEHDQKFDENSSSWKKVSYQIGNDSLQRGNEFALAKLDTDTPETKKLVNSLTNNGFFGLEPYHTNFILPISYGKDKAPRYSSAIAPSKLPNDLTYDKNIETEFQLSLKKQMSYDLFGFNEFIYFAYTQKVWWQTYSDSAPFRETNYLPEVYLSVPTSQKVDKSIGLKTVKFGFLHESNGQEGYRSRSWNRLYVTGAWQWGNLFLATRAWYRIPESDKSSGYYNGSLGVNGANKDGDDNPDIDEYLGYGDIKIDYLYGKSKFGLLIRNNLRLNNGNKGAVEFNYSYPFFNSPNTFWYIKIFHGYGESLIDYNREVTKAAFGFSFSRGLF